jgi:hypothetical protein
MGTGFDELETMFAPLPAEEDEMEPVSGMERRGLIFLLAKECRKSKLLEQQLELKDSQLNGVLRGLEMTREPPR